MSSSSSSPMSQAQLAGGSAAREAFERVKARLVGLSVALDDQERTAALLAEALASERGAGTRELEAFNAAQRKSLAAAEAAAARELSASLERSDALVGEKQRAAEAVKRGAAAAKRAAEATAKAVAAAESEAEAEIVAARKTWKEGEASRQQRFLGRKAEDAREVRPFRSSSPTTIGGGGADPRASWRV